MSKDGSFSDKTVLPESVLATFLFCPGSHVLSELTFSSYLNAGAVTGSDCRDCSV